MPSDLIRLLNMGSGYPPGDHDLRLLELRPASPSDAEAAVPLIHTTGAKILNYTFSPKQLEAETLALMRAAFVLEKGPFSYQTVTVAAAPESQRVEGIVQAYEGRLLERESLRFAGFLLERYGVLGLAKLARRALAVQAFGEGIPPRALYLAAIAIRPELRGRGLGTKLLEHTLELARRQGMPEVMLHVSVKNPGARALYERHGFNVFGQFSNPTLVERFGLEPQWAMLRRV